MMDAEGLDQQDIGNQVLRRPVAGEGRHGVEAEPQPAQLQQHEGGQDRHVQRPHPPHPSHQETSRVADRADPLAIGVGDDEARQDEEEVDEQIAVTGQRQGVEVAADRQMEEDHQDGAQAPERVQHVEPGGLGDHPAP